MVQPPLKLRVRTQIRLTLYSKTHCCSWVTQAVKEKRVCKPLGSWQRVSQMNERFQSPGNQLIILVRYQISAFVSPFNQMYKHTSREQEIHTLSEHVAMTDTQQVISHRTIDVDHGIRVKGVGRGEMCGWQMPMWKRPAWFTGCARACYSSCCVVWTKLSRFPWLNVSNVAVLSVDEPSIQRNNWKGNVHMLSGAELWTTVGESTCVHVLSCMCSHS